MTNEVASGGIILSRLTKSYGSVRAVRGVDLMIAPGETVALLGPNGAGKSTTIDMILGLTRPDSGSVSVFGLPPDQAVADGIVGGMLQTASLIEFLTVREYVTMVASLYPRPLAVDEVLRLAGAAEFAGRRTNQLSGGQAQRVRFAAALVANPDLMLLDEPTAAMDVEGRHEFWSAMRVIAQQGKTVVFATHYLEEADDYADRIVLLARGRVVADGSATEIKARVSGRVIRATLPGVSLGDLAALPGVTDADRHGDAVTLTCTDSDQAIRALLGQYPAARDIDVQGRGIEAAFLALTTDDDDENDNELQEIR
jgi:ABC-2 type transport system ATP-binding protein